MVTLDFLIAACLDPVQAALVLAVMLAYRGSRPILVAGAAAALISETIMMVWAADYVWGELIAPRLVAAVVQAAVLFWSIRRLRRAARSVGAALGRQLPGGAATLGAHETRPASRHIAPWHIRSHARRDYTRLQHRKLHR